MKSIHLKILSTILILVLISALTVGFIGVYRISKFLDKEATLHMQLICENKSQDLNSMFTYVENSVDNLATISAQEIANIDSLWNNPTYRQSFSFLLEKNLLNLVTNSDYILATYVAYNPEKTSPTEGFFWTRDSADEPLREVPRTNLYAYDPSDISNVGWYYIPVANGVPTWMTPYENADLNKLIISYVVPMYTQGELIGVVGVDIDLTAVVDLTSKIVIYESGFAYITDSSANVIYHPYYDTGYSLLSKVDNKDELLSSFNADADSSGSLTYKINNKENIINYQPLRNDMYFCTAVPVSEILSERTTMVHQILLGTLIVIILAGITGIYLSHNLVKPLKTLSNATKKILNGDWNIELEKITHDEVGELTEAFQKMIQYLNEYITTTNTIAYVDMLTGVRNKTAYNETVDRINSFISKGDVQFAVAVFDVNNLKDVNDNFGHNAGDALIKSICSHICDVFKHSAIYRIGGDEFAAVIETKDLLSCEELLESFIGGLKDLVLEEYPGLWISAGAGVAIYDKSIDNSFADVFERADYLMYKSKKELKQQREEALKSLPDL